MTVDVVPVADGFEVVDNIERRRCRLRTSDSVDPEPDTAEFTYPVDAAARIITRTVTLPEVVNTLVRAADGSVLTGVDHFQRHEFGPGTYFVEFSAAVKLYLRVEGPMTVRADATEITVDLGTSGDVRVGARSYHEHPAATVTTTARPSDVMRAVSHLGSALKTHTPDRSYPTLRGHPPELAVGDRFEVPSFVEPPDTGLRIEVPPTLGAVFPVAPLSYYLGAAVVPGPDPRLVADGFEHPLGSWADGDGSFETAVERVLKQTFFLDCLARTEAGAGPSLHERRALEGAVDLPFAQLAELGSVERLQAYLQVPFETIEPSLPQWKLTAHVEPAVEHVEILPFLVNDLAVIRTPRSHEPEAPEAERAAIDAYLRSGTERGTPERGPTRTIRPDETDSLEQAWIGEETPIGASKALVEAYRNRLARKESDGNLTIVVVCNDDQMATELESAGEVYGSREDLPFDVTTYTSLTRDRLQLVLESDIDFLHYIGHIDEAGFQCSDGPLDVGTVERVGVEAFFLNACSSYTQGIELIKRGAIGGVVTLDDVINSGAVRVGKTMARLLNRGFPLRPALNIARERSIVGSQYIVVGDGNIDIAHAEGLAPTRIRVQSLDEGDGFAVHTDTYPTDHFGVGSIYRPEIAANEEYFLMGSRNMDFTVGRDRLADYLNLEVCPVLFNGEFTWSNEVDLDAL